MSKTDAIRKLWQDYADAVNAGDLTRFAATLADDIVFLAPDQKGGHR